MSARTSKAWRRTALANAVLLATSLGAVALHHAGPAGVAVGTEISVEEGLKLIAAQSGSFEFFMLFEGVSATSNVPKGEVSNPAPGAIPIRAFALGAEMPVTLGSTTGGAGTGKAKLNALKITKSIDSSSPSMFANLTTGQHMKQLTLVVRKTGLTNASYLSWQFNPVFFSKIDWAGEVAGLTETVEMLYGSLRISYARTTSTGTLSPPMTTQWNQLTNTPSY